MDITCLLIIASSFFDRYTNNNTDQLRTQKIFMGGFHSVSYGGHLYLVCSHCDVTIWRYNSCFQTNVLAKFVDIICIFFYTHPRYFMCHCTEYKLSALQVRISEENKLNATTQQFITAKISGCFLKQGSKTYHHYVRAIYKGKIKLRWCLFEYEQLSKESVRLDWLAHPVLQDWILLNYTRIENAHEIRKKTFNFVFCIEVQQT